ncbi:MAG: peptidase M3, partial [Hyphomicrobiales bacterium]|nr:peptidase M3 [Hyphomicrobiales bacterium]
MDTHTDIHDNPLLGLWDGPFGAPPFAWILPEHFRPAFDAALATKRAEIAAIADDPAAPTFENTIAALERSGKTLDRVESVFFNLVGSDSNEALQALEREMAPILSRERSAILQNDALFRRIETLHADEARLGLEPEAARVLDRYRTAFIRAGAGLPAETKARLAAIGERLAMLGANFGQNVLADEKAFLLILEPEDLEGLPESFLAAAAETASERGHPGKHAVTLSRSSVEPFLQFSARRDLREKVFRAFLARGANGGANDNA